MSPFRRPAPLRDGSRSRDSGQLAALRRDGIHANRLPLVAAGCNARPVSGVTDPFPRVRRLDAQRLVDALAEQNGVCLTVVGRCRGGQVGAAYVSWPGGRIGVLTWRPDFTLAELYRGPLAVADALRERGYPAPGTQLTAHLGHAVDMVQQMLPGTTVDHFDASHLEHAVVLNALQQDALADRS